MGEWPEGPVEAGPWGRARGAGVTTVMGSARGSCAGVRAWRDGRLARVHGDLTMAATAPVERCLQVRGSR